MLEIYQFPCLHDNYAFLLRDEASGATAVVDTPEVAAIERALATTQWQLSHILNTHHHPDHAGGNLALKERYGCTIVGCESDRARIPGIDVGVAEGDVYALGETRLEVFETSGHTIGHIVYLSRADRAGFVGDTLFSLGCGRLFEGTPEQMWGSLQKIMAWPDDTRIYCAHEYTAANAAFAVTVEPGNAKLLERAQEIRRLRSENKPTVPTLLKVEKETNPFLRPHSANLQQTLELAGSDLTQVFTETRRRKDNF